LNNALNNQPDNKSLLQHGGISYDVDHKMLNLPRRTELTLRLAFKTGTMRELRGRHGFDVGDET